MACRAHPILAQLFAVLAATGGVAAQEPTRTFAEFETPDGSRFLLVPDASPDAVQIVHWAVVTPVGLAEDAPGREGLARAVARASLNGTVRYGSRDASREVAALRTLDVLERRLADTKQRGESPSDELGAELAAARASARELGDPTAWRTALRQCPSLLEIAETDDSFVLRVTALAESLPRVALLLLDRRENARLRGVREEFHRVREELRAAQGGPLATVRRELLGLAYLGSPAGRLIDPEAAGFTFEDALSEHREIQQPERSYHVLTGGFDPATVRTLLEKVFARTAIEPVPAPPPPARTEGGQRTSSIPTTGMEAYAVAAPLDPATDARQLAVLGRLLAGGPDSLLGKALRTTAGRPVTVDFAVPFPPDRRAGLFLLEVREASLPPPENRGALPPLSQLARDALRAIGNEDVLTDEAVTEATRQVVERIEIARASPGRLAFDLARWCGVLGVEPATALRPFPSTNAAETRRLATALFVDGPRIEVSLERTR